METKGLTLWVPALSLISENKVVEQGSRTENRPRVLKNETIEAGGCRSLLLKIYRMNRSMSSA